jgi:succinate dehydrogenase / fumarate reductase flavoprotein subunit
VTWLQEQQKNDCDAGYGIEANDTNEGVYLDFSTEFKKRKTSSYAKGNHNPSQEEIIS